MTTKLEGRDPAAWSELARNHPKQAAKDLDALAALRRRRGDPLSRLAAALDEDAADRLRGGNGTIPGRSCACINRTLYRRLE
jgi:hypothetical protein